MSRQTPPTAADLPRQYKNRSYGAVLATALRAVTGSAKTIARRLWPYALAYALAAAYVTVGGVHRLRSDVAQQMTMPTAGDLVATAVALLLLLATGVALYGRIGSLLGDGPRLMPYMMRSLRLHALGCGVTLAVMVVVVAAYIAVARLNFLWTIYAVEAVAWLLLLPYIYVAVSYLVGGGRLRALLTTGYRRGLRHYAFIFVTWLLTWIVTTVVAVVLCLPMMVMLTALGTAVGGAMLGDELGLPTYFYPLMYGVAVLTFVLLTSLITYTVAVYHYMAGTIDARTDERRRVAAGMSRQPADN